MSNGEVEDELVDLQSARCHCDVRQYQDIMVRSCTIVKRNLKV